MAASDVSFDQAVQTNEIIEFVTKKGYDNQTINKIKESKISIASIHLFSKEDILELGIALADVYLMFEEFVHKPKANQNRDELRTLLETTRKNHSRSSKYPAKRLLPSNVTVQLRWYNYDKKKRKHIQVRESGGGGIRAVSLNRSITYHDILERCKKKFFPNGRSNIKGRLSKYTYYLADFSMAKLENIIELHNETKPLTLQTYIDKHSPKVVKFFFMTQTLSATQEVLKLAQDSLNNISDDDFELPAVIFRRPEDNSLENINNQQSGSANLLPSTSTPTQTHSENQEIRDEQDRAFSMSLASDRKKEKDMLDQLERNEGEIMAEVRKRTSILKENIETITKMEDIRKARQNRIIPEPDGTDDACLISVRHPTLGTVKRLFKPSDSMQAVYDWVGSMCHEPLYFNLLLPASTILAIFPDEKVSNHGNSVLIMNEVDEPIENSNNESITFQVHHEDLEAVYNKVEHKRDTVAGKLSPVVKILFVNRDTVFEDVIKTYMEEPDILRHRLRVMFNNEVATGDGVAREAFSIFLEQLFLRTFDGRVQYIPVVQLEFSEDEFLIVGKILYHFYINFAVFPVQISAASLSYIFCGELRTSSLIQSFFDILSKADGNTINATFYSNAFEKHKLIDILSSFGIRSNPSKDNIRDLIIKAAKSELITKPLTAWTSIKEAFNGFFEDLPKSCITVLYEKAMPSNSKVLSYMHISEANDKLEETTIRFLKRFIEDANPSTLKSFLRFVTGSSFILPGITIAVNFQNLSEFEARPIAKTCIKSLVLPKNFNTYIAFENNLKYYLEHQEHWVMED